MFKISFKVVAILAVLTTVVVISLQFLSPRPALSKLADGTLVATAAQPPSLVAAKLGGKPVYVLYVTRSSDTVLVRCYPGYQPTLSLRTMGAEPGMTPGKEGVMTCKAPS
jgi:hypothetical protein